MFVSSGAVGDSRANQLCRQLGVQARIMWLDAEANLWQLSTREGVAETVKQCKAANINTIIVDVKPLSGMVLYRSSIAPRLTDFGGKPYPKNYDLLRTVVEEGHKAGIRVHAAINVFSEGSQTQNGGPAYKHTDWQCVRYSMERTISLMDQPETAMKCSESPQSPDEIGISGSGAESFGWMPEGTCYVRVTSDGRPEGHGTAVGKARLSAPEGGYVLVGSGSAGDWLRAAAERKAHFVLNAKGVLRKISDGGNVHSALFVNPLNPKARSHALGVIREICTGYAVDGIVLDRMRYPNIYTDFSDLTRKAFEAFVGHSVGAWPEDVFRIDPVPGREIIRGSLFKSWLKFRAKVIRDFLSEARTIVKSRRRDIKLGIYVGSWYPLYYDVGVNWGSRNHSTDLEWWPDGYQETGYADLVDYMCTGCYYAHPTRKEATAGGDEEWKSVEAAADESINAVKDDTFVYAGLYVYQYQGRPQKFTEAIRQCFDKTQGCMLFDLVYVRDYGWWDILKQEFAQPKRAPHDVPGLLGRIRGRAHGSASK